MSNSVPVARDQEPEVYSQLNNLESALSILDIRVGVLVSRLSPVSRIPEPGLPIGEPTVESELSPIAETLRTEVQRVNMLTDLVIEALGRLEI